MRKMFLTSMLAAFVLVASSTDVWASIRACCLPSGECVQVGSIDPPIHGEDVCDELGGVVDPTFTKCSNVTCPQGPFCGDGNLDPGEECDDGNNDPGDGCSPTCDREGTGCTPGFWKQDHHFDSWTTYSPDDSFDAVFGVDAPGDKTLLETLEEGGGAEDALGRHAVAALLNAASPDVDYAFTEAEVIAIVQDAYATGEFEDAKDTLEEQNELECELD